MAKRFTDSDKWKKPFIRSLPTAYKLLFIYICDECDHAGIWQVDLQVAEIKMGEKFDLKTAEKLLKDKIISFAGGNKWFIPDFIDFQYGTLNPENRAHNSVIRILEKYQLIDENFKPLNKPLTTPLRGDKDMDKDKEKDKELDKDKVKVSKQRARKENAGTWETCIRVWFEFYESKFKEKPSFAGRDPASMKKLLELVSQRVIAKNFEWTPETCEDHFLKFLQRAYADSWLSQNFLLQNLCSQFDKIIVNGKNGKINGKEPTGANVDVAAAFEEIDRMYGKNGNT